MSRENMEVARRMADAFERGDLATLREYYDPDIEWHEDSSFPEAGVYRGLDALEAYTRDFLSGFSEIHYKADQLIDAGEHVIANMRITGRGKTSGAGFEISAWWAFTFREGKVIRCYSYLARNDALEAVGLRE